MATEMLTVKAEARVAAGKGAARRVRRSGFVPAIAYGKGLPSTPLSVAPKEVAAILKSERGKNSVFQLATPDKTLVVMVREFVLHPIARTLEHVDFIEVKLDQAVDVEIPLLTTGKCIGVTNGGVLRVVYRMLPIRCLPGLIPVKVEADVTALELGEHLSTRDLSLPEGVVARIAPEQTIISVVAPEKETEEAPVAAAAGAAVAGAAGAPAAGAAPAADAAAAAGKDDAKEKKKK
ncbi:MAG: 50S ribosomal protein L25 [Polyangiaceae bacterium]|jgi:large subunit ribosomal protein L25